MAYADIMAKVLSTTFSVLLSSYLLMVITMIVIDFPQLLQFNSSYFLLNQQSCHDEEDDDGEEVKSFEVSHNSKAMCI